MSERSAELDAFLAAAGWQDSGRDKLAGDASSRRYERIFAPNGGASAVLMDSQTQSVAPFVRITQMLRQAGLSAPNILAQDQTSGLLLLEDLGDATFTRCIAADPDQESKLYAAAVDALLTIQAVPVPDDFTVFDSNEMAGLANLAFECYAQPVTRQDCTAILVPRLCDAFASLIPPETVFAHRDFHADNLIWLPDRSGPAQVGLLDYQDAVSAHPAYDLVSLLQDARRDVPPELERRMLAKFAESTGSSLQAQQATYAALGLQRNLRILGIFARLARTGAKPRYLDLIPRVFAHVERNLAHPSLTHLSEPLLRALPRPTPAVLTLLRESS